MSLKYEPASEQLHIYVKYLFSTLDRSQVTLLQDKAAKTDKPPFCFYGALTPLPRIQSS